MSALSITKFTIDSAAFKELSSERRSAFLLLGHLMNEANWLRKLLVQAVLGIDENPEGQAQFSLAITLSTILASKLYEGWLRITSAELGPTLGALSLPAEHVQFRKELKNVIEGGLPAAIRNKFGFHYPKTLDFTKMTGIDDADTVIYGTSSAYNGDLFSHVSAMAAIDSLISHDDNPNWEVALKSVWEGITDASGRYCLFVSELMGVALKTWLPGKFRGEASILPDAPTLDGKSLVFFAHPPPNLEEMIAATETRKS